MSESQGTNGRLSRENPVEELLVLYTRCWIRIKLWRRSGSSALTVGGHKLMLFPAAHVALPDNITQHLAN